jgi:peptide deformylase
MKVLTTPNFVLRQTADLVTAFDESLKVLVKDMFETMSEKQGIGLAAPQVGVSLKVIVTSIDSLCLINPVILESSTETSSFLEGCLSIPGKKVNVQRPESIHVEYSDLLGTRHKEWFSGLKSRVIQHEVDHLDGILMTDRMK